MSMVSGIKGLFHAICVHAIPGYDPTCTCLVLPDAAIQHVSPIRAPKRSQDGEWNLVSMKRPTSLSGDEDDDSKNADDADIKRQDTRREAATPSARASLASDQNGVEEVKSSDSGDERSDDRSDDRSVADDLQRQDPDGRGVVGDLASKWQRELCSLKEMGFEDTARNIVLLEKHVTAGGAGGMER